MVDYSMTLISMNPFPWPDSHEAHRNVIPFHSPSELLNAHCISLTHESYDIQRYMQEPEHNGSTYDADGFELDSAVKGDMDKQLRVVSVADGSRPTEIKPVMPVPEDVFGLAS